MIRIVCNQYNHQCSIYELQIMSVIYNRWVTMARFNHLLEGVKRFGTAILDEYPMITNKLS